MDELLEKEIMNVFWSLNKPCLISDILNADTSLNRNTVAKALVSLDYVNHTRLLNSIRINTSMPQTSLAFFSTLLENFLGLFSCGLLFIGSFTIVFEPSYKIINNENGFYEIFMFVRETDFFL